jgi:hypothetical protein
MATKGSKIQTLIDKTLHTQKKPNDSATRTQKQEDRGKTRVLGKGSFFFFVSDTCRVIGKHVILNSCWTQVSVNKYK